MRSLAVALIASLVITACTGDGSKVATADRGAPSTTTAKSTGSTPATPGTSGGAATPTTQADPVPLRAVQVIDLGTETTDLVVRPGDDRLYAAERAGRVREVVRSADALRRGRVVLDITGRVGEDGGERGLLGLAFSPDGSALFVSYTAGNDNGASVIERYLMDGDTADASTRREILRIAQPFANHNGGGLAFGPDGYLYAGFGDGGSQGDPSGNGQNRNVLLGKMLRLDVVDTPVGTPYRIPPDNPFAGGGGRPEVFAYGLRNPWRFSFDPANGDLWIGDVGGAAWEEIDKLPATDGPGSAGRGANLGWALREGRHDTPTAGPRPADLVDPVQEYSHDDGACSVTGGVVVRGDARVPSLDGWYLYSDYCDGVLRAVPAASPEVGPRTLLTIDDASPVSFTLDPSGDVYVVTLEGAIYRLDAA